MGRFSVAELSWSLTLELHVGSRFPRIVQQFSARRSAHPAHVTAAECAVPRGFLRRRIGAGG